jgi:hypothetical protein
MPQNMVTPKAVSHLQKFRVRLFREALASHLSKREGGIGANSVMVSACILSVLSRSSLVHPVGHFKADGSFSGLKSQKSRGFPC